jgi:hypothetical protein
VFTFGQHIENDKNNPHLGIAFFTVRVLQSFWQKNVLVWGGRLFHNFSGHPVDEVAVAQ